MTLSYPLRRETVPSKAANARLRVFVAAPQEPGAVSSSEMSDCGEQIFAGERLLDQHRPAVSLGKLLPSVPANEGKWDAARLEHVGDAGDRLARKMRVEKSAVHHLALDRLESVPHGPGRADHGDARLLQHARDVQSDEEFVFNDEHALCCHAC